MTRYGKIALIFLCFCAWGNASAYAQVGPGDFFSMGNAILQHMQEDQARRYEPYQPRRVYRPSYSRSDLAEAQSILNSLGYRAGVVDGQIGPQTRNAIADFQSDRGMAVTGQFSYALLTALRDAAETDADRPSGVASAWTTGSGQGYTEYSTRSGSSSVTLSCDEAASLDHSGTGIGLEIDGRLVPPGVSVSFDVDGRTVDFTPDRGGGLSTRGCPECARKFRRIWTLLRDGRMLTVYLSNGSGARFLLAGASRVLPAEPCPTTQPVADAGAGDANAPAAAARGKPADDAAASSVPWAPGCTYLDLARASGPTEISGEAPADDVICYAVKPVSGSDIAIKVVSGRNVIFSVKDRVDAVDHYAFRANGSGYVINVGQLMRAVHGEPFRISIAGGQSAKAEAPPTKPASPADDSVRDKAMRYLDEQNATAGVGRLKETDVDIRAVDLNGDGTPEALAFVHDPGFCGSAGCSISVLDLSGPQIRSVGDFLGDTLVAMPSTTNGWHDLALNGLRQVYDGHQYVAAWKLRDRNIVAYVQRLLNERGYDAGPVDGQMGGRTRRAIRQFKHDTGLRATSGIDRELIMSLETSHAEVAPAEPAPTREATSENRPADSSAADSTDGSASGAADARVQQLSCAHRPSPSAFTEPKYTVPTDMPDNATDRRLFTNGPDLIHVARTKRVSEYVASGGDDTVYVDGAEAGTAVSAGNGADTIVVCGLGDLSLLLMLGPGPADTEPDTVVIDTEAFRSLPPGSPTITIGGFDPANDRVYVRAPPGAKVTYTNNLQLSVGGVRLQFFGEQNWAPFGRGKKVFNLNSIFVSTDGSGRNWIHPPRRFASHAVQGSGAAARTISPDSGGPITLADSSPPPVAAGLPCNEAGGIKTISKPIEEPPEKTFDGTYRRFPATDDTIVVRGHQGIDAGAGDDQAYLFDMANGTSASLGAGADLVRVCSMADSSVSLVLSLGEDTPLADVDPDVVVLDAAVFRNVPKGFIRFIRIFKFEPANDRLVISVPEGLDASYRDEHTGGVDIVIGNVVVAISRADSFLKEDLDWHSVIVAPEGYRLAGGKPAGPENKANISWRYGQAHTLSGRDVAVKPPKLSCADVADPGMAAQLATPVNKPDHKWESVLETYSRGDDLIRLAGTRKAYRLHGGRGDDRIYLDDIGDNVMVYGNAGADLIVLCSMHGATVNLSLDADVEPDTIIINPAVFRGIPHGIERHVTIDGFNWVNDRLIIRVPDGLKVSAPLPRSSGQELQIGTVIIDAGYGTHFNDMRFDRDSVAIVPAFEE